MKGKVGVGLFLVGMALGGAVPAWARCALTVQRVNADEEDFLPETLPVDPVPSPCRTAPVCWPLAGWRLRACPVVGGTGRLAGAADVRVLSAGRRYGRREGDGRE